MAQDNLKYFLINIMSYSFHVQSEKKSYKAKKYAKFVDNCQFVVFVKHFF